MKSTQRILIALYLALLTCVSLFTSCTKNDEDSPSSYQTSEVIETEPHTHSYEDWSVAKKATCIENGLEERYCCCGEKQERSITATGHSFGEWIIDKPASCTEDGKEISSCLCGEKQEKTIAATGHHFGNWVIFQSAKCTEPGEEVSTCRNCNEKQTREIAPKGHNFGEWTLTQFPTCLSEGENTRYCICGIKETQAVAIVEHNYENRVCTFCGKTTATSQGLEYTLSPDGKSYYLTDIGKCLDIDIVIPSEYNMLPVTRIDNDVFNQHGFLRSVIIPDSVISIGVDSFSGCDELTSVTLGNGLQTIEDEAFVGSTITSIHIPASVSSIGTAAFYGCDELTDITFCGTKAEWQLIKKGEDWNRRCPFTVVHCSDGDISIN